MAESEKAYNHQYAETTEDNVEMEFKVADYNDPIVPGWRLACVCDVENNIEQLKSELCGMTLHMFSLADGTVGGPGYGYQITNKTDTIHDHKLLISDPNSKSSSVITVTDEIVREVDPTSELNLKTEITESSEIGSDEVAVKTTVYTETLVSTSEQSCYISSSEKDGVLMKSINSECVNVESSSQASDSIQISKDVIPSNLGIEREIDSDALKTLDQPVTVTVTLHQDIDQKVDLSADQDGATATVLQKDEAPLNNEIAQNNKSGNKNDSNTLDNTPVTEENSLIAHKDRSSADEDSRKNSSDSSSSSKKKKKPMSEAMQRLTAKKADSPESKRSTDLALAAKRKAKADEDRKRKIAEQRNKDEERRAAVLERKKKLEEADREKKEALFKKLTSSDSAKPVGKNSGGMKKHSSTSNLVLMKKRQERDNLNATTCGSKSENNKSGNRLTARPKSAMHKPISSISSKEKPQPFVHSRKGSDPKRPMTAEPRLYTRRPVSSSTKSPSTRSPTTTSTKKPLSTQAQHPRAFSAIGITNTTKRKSLQPKTSTSATPPTKVADSAAGVKRIPKSKSETGMLTKDKGKESITKASHTRKEVGKKEEERKDVKNRNNKSPEKKSEKEKPLKTSTPKEKISDKGSRTRSLSKTGTRKLSGKPTTGKTEKAGQMTEEEAKKALAERRKKVKEEAEAKAKAEQEKDELERIRREEEEKRLAEQLKVEEEKQHALMEQLKEEEEERRQRLIDEKEQRERAERERLEDEQRQREEEIERKAKLEINRIQKEQERQEMLLESERIERKKRVEKIMARVSSKRSSNLDESESPSPVEAASPEVSNTARLKVDGILRSRGLGRSTEDISILTDKPNDSVENSQITNGGSDNNENELKSDIALSAANVGGDISSNGSLLENHCTLDDVSVPLEESPAPLLAGTQVSADAPAAEISISSNHENVSQGLESVDRDKVLSGDSDELPLENVSEIVLSTEGNHVASIGNDISVNDTNNNKDYFLENKPTPISAWSENDSKNGVVEAEEKQSNETHKKFLNHDNETANVGLLAEEHKNGDDVNNIGSETVGIHSISGVSIKGNYEESSKENENSEWGTFEQRMKQIQPDGAQVVSNDENKLWKVLEGQVEMSECF